MKLIYLFGLVLSVSAMASDFPELPPITKIEGADIVCESHGAKIAFNTKKRRVWQADPGRASGIEIKVTEFTPARCRNCYEVIGTMASVEWKYNIYAVREDYSKAGLTVSTRSAPDAQWEEFNEDFSCTVD